LPAQGEDAGANPLGASKYGDVLGSGCKTAPMIISSRSLRPKRRCVMAKFNELEEEFRF
jgi:hypothetical protein